LRAPLETSRAPALLVHAFPDGEPPNAEALRAHIRDSAWGHHPQGAAPTLAREVVWRPEYFSRGTGGSPQINANVEIRPSDSGPDSAARFAQLFLDAIELPHLREALGRLKGLKII
jgi:hypothetical protein